MAGYITCTREKEILARRPEEKRRLRDMRRKTSVLKRDHKYKRGNKGELIRVIQRRT
jgi:hypothetical protein